MNPPSSATRSLAPIPPWLEATWQRLLGAHRQSRLGQALLLTGPLGIGKGLLADHLARLLLCTASSADERPCGACADCALLDAGHHPDRFVLAPETDGASGEIRAEQVRQLCGRETLTPMRGATKVLVVVPADAMNLFAANSLLKTLEEPVDSTVWILITEHPQRLSQTIRSRCQQISLTIPPAAQALPWLERSLARQVPARAEADIKAHSSRNRVEQSLALAQGAPFRALALAESGALERRQDLLEAIIGIARGEHDPLAVAHDWQGLEPSVALAAMIDGLTDLLRLSVDPSSTRMIHLGQRRSLTILAGQIEPVAGHRLLQRLLQARLSIDAPVNKQMLFEALLVHWARLTSVVI
ncbi:MAG: DNA polymerase III subunit delta' [Lamprobacter sp.]|uniref:DNA polymerase III subunit delta' n=1 Tax=Lamprobacter sp. TaxID=3100796 RepID=UPI002B263791|nr:DNA polymerase III subunit delta' [Lamprobacter sp.]MEA3638569.1 DNA polymerase III subunit delta' [Lamprobacter sp.]